MDLGALAAKFPINWQLIKNPANWIVVFLMIAIAGAGLAVIFNATSAPKGDESNG